jgi:hypothetical protein
MVMRTLRRRKLGQSCLSPAGAMAVDEKKASDLLPIHPPELHAAVEVFVSDG